MTLSGFMVKLIIRIKNFIPLFNIMSLTHSHCLYLQFNHYFETTYGSGYHTVDTSKVPEALKHLEGEFVSLRQLQSVTDLALRYIHRFIRFARNTFEMFPRG